MAYPETVKYLESFINYEKIPAYPYKQSLKLERIKDFLDTIGNPQGALRCIHVAGTKGKGSTCAFIAYILREAGWKVGLYTSPHLLDFRERIRILEPQSLISNQHNRDFEGMISEDALVDAVEKLKTPIEGYNKNAKYDPLSFFEVYTASAFVYFKEKKVDFAVLETGLGGRLDATNVVNPLVAAITPISYEHTQKLGNTLTEIAREKAGIIKSKTQSLPYQQRGTVDSRPLVVISAPQEEEAREVIRNKCTETGANLYEVGRDILYEKTKAGFRIKGLFCDYPELKTRLIGTHQAINAAVALGVIENLRFYNINIDADSIRGGFYNTVWPGRCEMISRDPLIVLDGAQNIASSKVLREAIRENFHYRKLILTLGISNDKDIRGICNELRELADEVVLTKAENPRAVEPRVLADYFNPENTHITNSVKEAKDLACCLAQKEDLILVCGSLFVVGEFRNGKVQH